MKQLDKILGKIKKKIGGVVLGVYMTYKSFCEPTEEEVQEYLRRTEDNKYR